MKKYKKINKGTTVLCRLLDQAVQRADQVLKIPG
jgi:hypothetical protein